MEGKQTILKKIIRNRIRTYVFVLLVSFMVTAIVCLLAGVYPEQAWVEAGLTLVMVPLFAEALIAYGKRKQNADEKQ